MLFKTFRYAVIRDLLRTNSEMVNIEVSPYRPMFNESLSEA